MSDSKHYLDLGIQARERAICFKSLNDFSRVREPELSEFLHQAIEHFDLAIDLQPDLYEAVFERGFAHAMRGDIAKALPDFKVSLAEARLPIEKILFGLSFFQGNERRTLAEFIISSRTSEALVPEFLVTLVGEIARGFYQEGDMLTCIEHVENLLKNMAAKEFVNHNVAGVSLLMTLASAYRAVGQSGKADSVDRIMSQIIVKLQNRRQF
jgi:tetratricopeptide (TPR) repeat protein